MLTLANEFFFVPEILTIEYMLPFSTVPWERKRLDDLSRIEIVSREENILHPQSSHAYVGQGEMAKGVGKGKGIDKYKRKR